MNKPIHIQNPSFNDDPLSFCGESFNSNEIILSDKLTIKELQDHQDKYDQECIRRLCVSLTDKSVTILAKSTN